VKWGTGYKEKVSSPNLLGEHKGPRRGSLKKGKESTSSLSLFHNKTHRTCEGRRASANLLPTGTDLIAA